MDLYEEIRSNAGIDDVEYLSEGIVFFKNSKKIGRLAKVINKKREKLIKKGDMASAQALKPLYDEAMKVADAFEKLEIEFKNSKGNDKTKIKEKYKEAEQKFKKLLKVAKKDSTKKALITAGGVAITIGILLAAFFGLGSMANSGVLGGAIENVGRRAAKFKGTVANPLAGSEYEAASNISGGLMNMANDMQIQRTNKDLTKLALGTGAVGAGFLTNGLLGKIRKAGRTNKTMADTAIALEGLDKLKDTKEETKEEK